MNVTNAHRDAPRRWQALPLSAYIYLGFFLLGLDFLGDEKTSSEYQLPKSVMKWIALGLLLTSAVVIAISILSGVKFSDLTKLGYVTFALAAGVTASRLLVQILRFRVITLGLAGDPKPNLSGLALTRVASEFVSLSTPPG